MQAFWRVAVDPTGSTKRKRTTRPGLSAVADESVELFDEFYEENAERIIMHTTYPLNPAAMLEWQEALAKGPPIVGVLGSIVATNLQHISFEQFYDTLRRCAYEAVDVAKRDSCDIVLFVDGRLNKSNVWVALLLWPIVKSRTSHVLSNIPRDFEHGLERNVLILHVDDASFSGEQALGSMRSQRAGVLVRNPHIRWSLLVAAITEQAKQMIRDYSPAIRFIGDATIVLETLRSAALKRFDGKHELVHAFMRDIVQNHGLFKIRGTGANAMVYFDHKLPDQISTVQMIIAMAPARDPQTHKVSVRSLIAGCKPEDYKALGGFGPALDTLQDFDETGVCPPAFYKRIVYTFRQKAIATDIRLADFFDRLSLPTTND